MSPLPFAPPRCVLQIFPTGVRATATGVALVLGLVGWLLATPVHDLYTTMPPLSLSLLSLAAVSPRHGLHLVLGASALRSHTILMRSAASCDAARCMQIRRHSAALLPAGHCARVPSAIEQRAPHHS